jgi:hypothetical protein
MSETHRTKWQGLVLGAFVSAAMLSPSAAQQKAEEPPAALSSRERFSGSLEPRGAALAAGGISVDIRHWSIGERQRIPGAKLTAFEGARTLTIYHLRAGELTTVVDGREVERRQGEFWTLRPGETMTFQTGDDTAVVETIVVDQGG